MQNEGQNNLYKVVENYIPKKVLSIKNKAKSWVYGYDQKYNFVVISKTGQIGEILDIQGLKIGLPLEPKKCLQRHKKKEEQYWERTNLPNELQKIQSIFLFLVGTIFISWPLFCTSR